MNMGFRSHSLPLCVRAIMDFVANLKTHHLPLNLSLTHHRPSFPKPVSFLSFRTLLPVPSASSSSSSCLFKFPSIRASSLSPSSFSFHLSPYPKVSVPETPNLLFSPFLKTICVTIAASAFFFMRFGSRPAIASPIAPATVETMKESTERDLEERLCDDPNDTEALRSLMEVRIKANKLPEAIEIIDRLIELEPDDIEWPLFKANLHGHMGRSELAKSEFEKILAKDPFRVEAYHGLVMSSGPTDRDSLKEISKRIEVVMEKCKKMKNKTEERDFKLLIAQIKVVEGSYFDALKVYQELVREEPRDFRPYLCQGIIYTLLRKNDEAEKQFEKFRKLVPKNHPYKEFFDDNMFATKLFAQKVAREEASSKI